MDQTLNFLSDSWEVFSTCYSFKRWFRSIRRGSGTMPGARRTVLALNSSNISENGCNYAYLVYKWKKGGDSEKLMYSESRN